MKTCAIFSPDGFEKNCTEATGVGNGDCYFVDSTHSNNWRNLRINNKDENLAYIECVDSGSRQLARRFFFSAR